MQNLKLVLVALCFLTVTLLDAQAQVRRGPRYNPPGQYPDHRPAPAPYPSPYPPSYPSPYPDYRPAPPMPDYRPVPDVRGRISCSASDTGWEEHWSGHSSCGDCLQDHGKCVEKCYEAREVCDVQGTDYAGRTITFSARGPDRWSAESEARRQCEWSRDMRSCVVTSCRSDNLLVSSRSCR